ncbi:MAG: hypothetical protein IT204_14555 [Fimbriimonadaceae bacterium]|nr:hypothetical protein [Fimbriimonadaceae bacterium]
MALRRGWVLLALVTRAGAAAVSIATFDPAEPFGERWAAQGQLTARRVELPRPAPAGGGPSGPCVELRAAAQPVFMTKRGVVPADWLRGRLASRVSTDRRRR